MNTLVRFRAVWAILLLAAAASCGPRLRSRVQTAVSPIPSSRPAPATAAAVPALPATLTSTLPPASVPDADYLAWTVWTEHPTTQWICVLAGRPTVLAELYSFA